MYLEEFAMARIKEDSANKQLEENKIYGMDCNTWICSSLKTLDTIEIEPTFCKIRIFYYKNDYGLHLFTIRAFNKAEKGSKELTISDTLAFNKEIECKNTFRDLCNKYIDRLREKCEEKIAEIKKMMVLTQ